MFKSLVKHPRTQSLLVWLAYVYSRVVFATSRVKIISPAPQVFSQKPTVFAIWHGQLFFVPTITPIQRKTLGLMSASRDGRLTAAIGQKFGIGFITGSSSKGAVSAARELIRAAKTGHTLFLTPDGPRGPIHVAKPGASEVARITGLPLIPVAGWSQHGWNVNSWDAMRIPRPFTTLYIAYGSVLAQGATPKDLSKALTALSQLAQQGSKALDKRPSNT